MPWVPKVCGGVPGALGAQGVPGAQGAGGVPGAGVPMATGVQYEHNLYHERPVEYSMVLQLYISSGNNL